MCKVYFFFFCKNFIFIFEITLKKTLSIYLDEVVEKQKMCLHICANLVHAMTKWSKTRIIALSVSQIPVCLRSIFYRQMPTKQGAQQQTFSQWQGQVALFWIICKQHPRDLVQLPHLGGLRGGESPWLPDPNHIQKPHVPTCGFSFPSLCILKRIHLTRKYPW